MVNALTDGLNKPDQLDTAGIQAAEIGSGAVMTYNLSGGQVVTGKIANNIAIGGTTGSVVIGNLTSSTGSLVFGAGTTLTTPTGSLVLAKDLELTHNAAILGSAVVTGDIEGASHLAITKSAAITGSAVVTAGAEIGGDIEGAGHLTLTKSAAITGSAVVTEAIETSDSVKAAGSVVVSTSYTVPYAVAGSPTSTAGLIIQAGSSTTDAGSDACIDFPLAFSTLPCSVVLQATETEGNTMIVSVTSTSGADIVSATASETFNWIAVGPA